MAPEYLLQLADIADPDQLWRLGWEDQRALPQDKLHQLDIGVALRRQAEHVRRLQAMVGTGMSLLITPLGNYNTTDSRAVRMPGALRRLMAAYADTKPKESRNG